MRNFKVVLGLCVMTLFMFSCREQPEKTSESANKSMELVGEPDSIAEDGADGGGAADTSGSRSDPSGKPDQSGTHDVHDASSGSDK